MEVWIAVSLVIGIVAGLVVGWCGCDVRRQLTIARHRRCPLCEGAGCVNDVTLEHQAARADELGRRGLL